MILVPLFPFEVNDITEIQSFSLSLETQFQVISKRYLERPETPIRPTEICFGQVTRLEC